MKLIIVIALALGAGWAYFQPESFNAAAAIALIVLGTAVVARGRHG